jgi:hypothetical protein
VCLVFTTWRGRASAEKSLLLGGIASRTFAGLGEAWDEYCGMTIGQTSRRRHHLISRRLWALSCCTNAGWNVPVPGPALTVG